MESSIRQKIGIRRKMASYISIASLSIIIIGVALGYFWGFNLLRSVVGGDHEQKAAIFARSVDRLLNEKIRDLTVYTDDKVWKEAIEKSNLHQEKLSEDERTAYFREMDKKWAREENVDLTKEYLESEIAQELKNILGHDKSIAELFITDRFGGLVASSGKTTDFYQADEEWWQRAYSEGKGHVYIGDIEFDESSKVRTIPISIPIKDGEGRVLGVAKGIVDSAFFWQSVQSSNYGSGQRVILITKNGIILSHPQEGMIGQSYCRDRECESLLENKTGWKIINKRLVAIVNVEHSLIKKEAWRVLLDQDAKEVFAPLNRLLVQALVLMPILIIITLPLGIFFGTLSVKSIKKMQRSVERIRKGDLQHRIKIDTRDEIEELADSFNAMLDDLKGTTTSINELNKEIKERKKTEEELKQKMADLELFKKATVDRELKMVELKKIIEELKSKNKKAG